MSALDLSCLIQTRYYPASIHIVSLRINPFLFWFPVFSSDVRVYLYALLVCFVIAFLCFVNSILLSQPFRTSSGTHGCLFCIFVGRVRH